MWSVLGVMRRDTLRRRLLILGTVIACALLGLSAIVLDQARRHARSWAESETLATARALAQMVDSRFATGEALLHGLAVSPRLREQDVLPFGREMQAAGAAANLGLLALARPDGELVLHTSVAPGVTVPMGTSANGAIRRAAVSGRTEIGDLFRGTITPAYLVAIAVPVLQPAASGIPAGPPAVRYVLSVALRADDLAAALMAQRLPQGSVAALIDRTGKVVARSEGQREFAGTDLVPGVRAAFEKGTPEAILRSRRIDGIRSTIALVRAPVSGFGIAIGVSQDSFAGQLGTSMLLAVLAGGTVALAALLLLLLLAVRVSRGIRWLGTLGDPEPQPSGYRGGLAEIDEAAAALTRAGARRDASHAALALREARFRGAFEAPVIGMAQIDPADGAILLANDRFCRILGHDPAALRGGGNLFALFAGSITEAHRARLRGGHAVTLAAEFQRPDEVPVSLELGLAPIRDPAVQPPRVVVVLEDRSGRRHDEQRQRLLTRELAHRAINALTVVQAAIRLTPRDDAGAYAVAVEARVAALARAHGLLAQGGWSGAGLRALVAGELTPFLPAGGVAASERVTLSGPPLMLRADAVQPLAMAIHELATNSTKYGALSLPGGRVAVDWSLEARPGFLRLRWAEAGGPPVTRPPVRRGFGSRLIEATVKIQLGGSLQRAWLEAGLVCSIDLPAGRTLQPAPAAEAASAD